VPLEYLAIISVKYRVFIAELFQAIVLARETGRTSCNDLLIEHRGSVSGIAFFLITKDRQVIAQFRVTEQFLQRKDIHFESWMKTDKIRRRIARQNLEDNGVRVQNLRQGMKKVKMEAKVLETKTPQLVYTQYGTSAMITDVWVADETGKVKLCLWNDQASRISVGDTIEIRGASVATYHGERQLRLGRSGVITVLQGAIKNKENSAFEESISSEIDA
jgi:replication factor A1